MTLVQSRPPIQTDRRTEILDAAEACFARSGFHRTTMQDVARAAGMVPGNLYNYFPSKDAIVAGLTERDRAKIAEDFASLAEAPDLMDAFRELGKRHFIEASREKAIIALEIWAEATHNPDIANLYLAIQNEVRSGIITVCREAQQRGVVHENVDVDALARLVLILSDGLMRRKAMDPEFDGDREVENVLSLIGALMCGSVVLNTCSSHHSA
jgi:TetR/AcrR family transcriptional repressor of uid operon